MGGKHKQAQRTKNNTRPSSSGRSAELLGTSIPTFVGFSAVKDGGFVPVIPGFGTVEDIDPNIDTNFQLALKKMSKKDAVTKYKALQEFTELVNNCDIEILKTILPFWPRLYCSLALDAEHKVREAAHIAQRSVAVKAKRNLAPYLKQLIGPWFTSQYDNYAPAASAAQQSFQDAFPPTKLPEVIAFCQEEILNYIYENLTQNIPQNATQKNMNEEELESRYQRIIVASLQGYALYLRKVLPPQIESAIESNKKLVTSSKFWKLSKHKVPVIRTAWFSALSALLQCAPTSLLENEGQRVTTTVLANLDETDPTVLPIVWETALLALFTVQDWWTHINVEKLVLPKLWRVLRDAAQGNATSIYPNLLPLISKFPPGSDSHAFYSTFFDNIRLGLKQKSVQQSRSELNSVVTSFTECLQYVILKNQHDINLCESLIQNQLMVTIEWCLQEGHFASKITFSQITNLIYYWSRNRNNTKDTPLYNQIIGLFWNELRNLSSKIIGNSELEPKVKLVEFLFQLKKNTIVKPKKFLKVQFSETPPGDETDLGIPSLTRIDNMEDRDILIELNENVYAICKMFADLIPEKGMGDNLYALIQEFDSKDLYNYLVKEYQFSGLFQLFKEGFQKWVNQDEEVVIDLIFSLFKYLGDDEQIMVLQELEKIENEESLLRCLNHGLAHPFRNMKVIRKWLKESSVLTSLLTTCGKNIINETENSNPKNLALLRLACAPDDSGDLLISSQALIEIINTFCKPLLNPESFPTILDTSARFASVLAAFIYSDENYQNYTNELLIALFTLSANRSVRSEILSEDTLWEINTAWQDAISVIRTMHALESNEFLEILQTFAKIVKTSLKSESIEADLIVNLIKNSAPNSTVGRVGYIYSIVMQYFQINLKSIVNSVLQSEILNGEYIYFEESELWSNEDELDLKQQMISLEFGIKLLGKLFEKNEDDEEEEETLPLKILIPEFENDVLSHLFYAQVLEEYSKLFKMSRNFELIHSKLTGYTQGLTALLNSLNSEMILQIQSKVLENAGTIGYFWCSVYKDLYLKYKPSALSNKTELGLFKDCLREVPEHCWFAWLKAFGIDLECIDLQKKSQLECLVTVRFMTMNESTNVYTIEALGLIKSIHKRLDIFLDKDISSKSWKEIQLVVEVIRVLCKIIKHEPHHLTSTHWDFVFISLYGWVETVRKSLKPNSHLLILAMAAATFDLFSAVTKCMENLKNDIAAGDAYKKLASEWDEVVSLEVNISIFNIYKQTISLVTPNLHYITLLQQLSSALPDFNETVILRSDHIKWRSIATDLVAHLSSDIPVRQIAATLLFQRIIATKLVELDTEICSGETYSNQPLTLVIFTPVLEKTGLIVDTMVQDLRLGEQTCQVGAYTEAFQYTSAYLLTWSVVLTMVQKASSSLKYQYGEWFREHDYIKTLLNNLLRLMPEPVLDPIQSSKLFENPPELNLNSELNSEWIETTTCALFGKTFSVIPALVRQWWSSSESRVSRIVDRITSTCISTYLSSQELQDLTNIAGENMQVKVHPTIREVIATYTVDDAKMEITITLPHNYPLGSVKVEAGQQIGASTQWRNSIMQLSLLLTHQNGTLMEGLKLWKNNLDKRFEGVEECYICFCVIHAGTYQLPKLSCQTCRKKFHSACLYKWFSTSNKSTCPICRNLF